MSDATSQLPKLLRGRIFTRPECPMTLRYELYALEAGDMYVYFPDPMSEADAADAEQHLMLLIQRIKRRALSAHDELPPSSHGASE